jgi:hypothetical protein
MMATQAACSQATQMSASPRLAVADQQVWDFEALWKGDLARVENEVACQNPTD